MHHVALIALLLPAFTLAAPIANGDFERGLDGWSPVKPADFANGDLSAVTDDVHAGQQALRILNPPGEKVLTGAITGFLPLPAEARSFEIRLWLKSVVAAQTMELRLAAMDAKGGVLVPYNEHGWVFLRPPVADSVGKWTEFSAMFLAQPDWGGVQLTVWVNGAGADVRFDDIQLNPVDTGPQAREIASTGGRLAIPVNGVALWTEGPLRKVYPDAEPPKAEGTGLDLAAPGDGHDIRQLCLRADRAVQGVTVTFSDLAGPGLLPAAAWQANWVGLVPVTQRMNVWSLLGPTPDPLLAEPAHDLAPGQTWALWITLHVPRGTAQGTYRGTVSLRLDGQTVPVPVQVRVYGFDLPERPRLRTIARVWQHHPDDLPLFYRDLQEHRASSTGAITGITAKLVDGKMVVDTSGVKAAAEQIRALGSQAYNVPSIYLGDWSGPYAKDRKWFGLDLFTPEFEQAYGAYCKQVGDAVRAEGLMGNALWQVWDEPHDEWIDRCARLTRLVRDAVPDARIYMTAAISPKLLDTVNIWNLPWPSTYNPELVAEARRHGASIWAYENELYPLDVPDSGLLMRGFPWRLRRYDVEGVEWWAVSKWRTDPWTEPNQYELQNGGGCFLYPTPDRKGRPIDSVRWELYRQGVEDYDVLTLLRERAPERYNELVEQVALSPAEVVRDPLVMERARRAACEAVE